MLKTATTSHVQKSNLDRLMIKVETLVGLFLLKTKRLIRFKNGHSNVTLVRRTISHLEVSNHLN